MKEKQSSYTYMAVFQKEKDGIQRALSAAGWMLDGGGRFQSALRMAQEAMSLHLYGMEQDGRKSPSRYWNPWRWRRGKCWCPLPFDDAFPGGAGEQGGEKDADHSGMAE